MSAAPSLDPDQKGAAIKLKGELPSPLAIPSGLSLIHIYVQFARAKGLPPRIILGRHVMRNAMVSTITLLGLSIGNLMSGTLVTETVFAVPGVGRLMLEAIFARDYPLIQGLTLTFAVIVSVVFLLTDVSKSLMDPRMRLS